MIQGGGPRSHLRGNDGLQKHHALLREKKWKRAAANFQDVRGKGVGVGKDTKQKHLYLREQNLGGEVRRKGATDKKGKGNWLIPARTKKMDERDCRALKKGQTRGGNEGQVLKEKG